MSIKIISLISLLFLASCNYKATKVTVVGAGNVGATAANVMAVNEVASEVVLIDIIFLMLDKFGYLLYHNFVLCHKMLARYMYSLLLWLFRFGLLGLLRLYKYY